MPHHVESFGTAVLVLVSHGHIKERLIMAFEDNLNNVDQAALPKSVRASFQSLRQRMMAVEPLNGEGPICASVRKMSICEADECARTVVEIHAVLLKQRKRPAAAAKKAVVEEAVAEAAKVPAMLLKSV